ncbi:MAG: phosphocholine cytidylyltransferase family protein [Rhizomicrobium sp.]|nr:phosphocholine cytidylyltransferase family protein [Rhizomicrobium sp.]
MKALILAAGRGSRLGPRTADRPKGLVELGGKSLIARAITSLTDGGCSAIALVTGYRAETLAGLTETRFHNPRWAETNMVASLMTAEPWLQSEKVIVSYSDIFYTPETVRALAAAPGEIVVSFDPEWQTLWEERSSDPLSDAESFKRDDSGTLIDIGRRVTSFTEIEGQYMGLVKFSPAGWKKALAAIASLPAHEQDRLDMTSLLARLIAKDVAIATVAKIGPWGECDNESDLAVYERWLAQGVLTLP